MRPFNENEDSKEHLITSLLSREGLTGNFMQTVRLRLGYLADLLLNFQDPPKDADCLLVVKNKAPLYWRPLNKTYFSVGRSDEADLCLDDPGVSRIHCHFNKTGDQWEVIDAKSKNGISINGAKTKEDKVGSGDIVEVGNHELILVRT